MNNYESVIILKPNFTKNKKDIVISEIRNKINKISKITKEEDLGVRTLAYEIKRNKQGHYLIFQFEMKNSKNQNKINELEHYFKINEDIIKFIIVKN